MEAWKIYRSLTSEQKAILSSKRLEVNRPVDDILALVRPLAACDAIGNKVQTGFGCTFGLAIVASIVLGIAFSNIGWSALTLTAIVGVLALAILTGWFYFWLRSIDVSNNLRSFVVPVLALFREDFDPKHPLHLRVDLDKPTAKTKKTGESAPYSRGAYHRIIDATYVDGWMSADAVLVDGTKLSWNVTDRIRERTKTKRNARGKYKTKTQYTKKTDLEVTMALRTKSFALAGAEVSKDGKRNKVEVRQTVRSKSLDPADPRVLIDAITGVYRSARPVKKEVRA
jgi:hypothetical protein